MNEVKKILKINIFNKIFIDIDFWGFKAS
jgi:hypothetical protein